MSASTGALVHLNLERSRVVKISNYASIMVAGLMELGRMSPIESRTRVEPLRPEYAYICPNVRKEPRKREKRMRARRAQRLRKRRM